MMSKKTKKRIEKTPKERESDDDAPDYEAESASVADDLRVMLDGYTAEDVAFALLRPRDTIKDGM